MSSEDSKNPVDCGCKFDGVRGELSSPCSAEHTPMEQLVQFGFAQEPVHAGQETRQKTISPNWT